MAIKQIDLYLFLQGPVNLKIRAHMLIRFLCLMSNSGCMSLMYILHIHIAIFSFVHPLSQNKNLRKSLIYLMRKAFLERAVVELVYKFDKKSCREYLKR